MVTNKACDISVEKLTADEIYIIRMHDHGGVFGDLYYASVVVEYDSTAKIAHAKDMIGDINVAFIRSVCKWVRDILRADEFIYERMRPGGKVTNHKWKI